MMRVYTSAEELIGRTPILELTAIEKKYDLKCRLFAKLEFMNVTGSAKDRVAKNMIEDAERTGALKPGGTIIEPTSGNTGIGLAAVGVSKGYRVIIVMPDSMSVERQLLMKAYGAELVLTEGAKGMQGSIEKAREIQAANPGSFIPDQFSNPSNSAAHRETTGPEIYEDMDGKVDIFVASVGTGGTITGVGEYLKSRNSEIKVIGVEPLKSNLLTGGSAAPHGIQGIGANFIPDVLNRDILDEVIDVKDEDAFTTGGQIGRECGILAGISSGATLWAAIEVCRRADSEGKNVVALFTDTGERYLSSEMFK
ncbi:MAG: cysteine synthase A [Lachnospiraceae bacterium]|nr:cysteine synthase A [Lachnospiraceae bacterium]